MLGRPVSVRDSIQMTSIGDLAGAWTASLRPAVFSPDYSQFIVETCKGNLDTNTNDCALLLYTSKEVKSAVERPLPNVLVQLSSASQDAAIVYATIRWLADNRTLVCIGTTNSEPL